jgi:chorismate synthase
MSNVWGRNIKLSIFGESHGPAVGIVIDGLPPGEPVDMTLVEADMERRAPGRNEYSTARSESDRVEILSGLFNGRTTGFPLCGQIRNNNTRSGDYSSLLRPGHADMTALIKYGGHADMRGGGHFSGRLTAPVVFAGSIAGQILGRAGIEVFAKIDSIGGIMDAAAEYTPAYFKSVRGKAFPVLDDEAALLMKAKIADAKRGGDSVGGIVSAAVFGLPPGLGEPFFDSAESVISSMLFSVPAVKGVEFGDGFALAAMYGSGANDAIEYTAGSLAAKTNHNGGILGGITNGMPLTLRAAVKPTPSIARPQETVDGATMEPAVIQIKGRHDPCIVPRAVPVIECAVALCILDMYLEFGGERGAQT